ncbi:MAG: hypothetical protein HC824_03600 [Synechococcales cyanobacterium RM1_1_8]|nr:hypothetical protein [Synechococcales cyanobacterium RM1_1_8]
MNKFESNKFESKQSQPKLETDQGWIVQIYGSNRRLLCVLEPSHGWIFLTGCCMGLLLSITWINVARHSIPVKPSAPAAPTKAPAFQVD